MFLSCILETWAVLYAFYFSKTVVFSIINYCWIFGLVCGFAYWGNFINMWVLNLCFKCFSKYWNSLFHIWVCIQMCNLLFAFWVQRIKEVLILKRYITKFVTLKTISRIIPFLKMQFNFSQSYISDHTNCSLLWFIKKTVKLYPFLPIFS